MEGFKNGTRFPEAEFGSEKNVYKVIHEELKGIMRGMDGVEPELKKCVFDRMINGPEVPLLDPELSAEFVQIAEVEEKYGRERVAELAAFYDTPAAE